MDFRNLVGRSFNEIKDEILDKEDKEFENFREIKIKNFFNKKKLFKKEEEEEKK